MKTTYFIWFLPFSFFIAGYLFMARMVTSPTLETPYCIGKNIQEALSILTEHDLNAKLLEEKEDNDLLPGTIIAQHPSYKQKVKPHQTIFLVISKAGKKIIAPTLIGKPLSEFIPELKNNTILYKNYFVPSTYPQNICIAQLPLPGQPLHNKKIITYCAQPPQRPVIFPDITDSLAVNVIEFLQKYDVIPQISHVRQPDKQHLCKLCTVTDQKPLAGSIVTLDASLTVHLHINHT